MSSDPNDSIIVEAEKRIFAASESLTKQLRGLIDMQPSIQMVQAIHAGIGPDANLRDRIGQHIRDEPSLEMSDKSSTASTESYTSNKSNYEQCPSCKQWLPSYALPSHVESHPQERSGVDVPSSKDRLPQPTTEDRNRSQEALKLELASRKSTPSKPISEKPEESGAGFLVSTPVASSAGHAEDKHQTSETPATSAGTGPADGVGISPNLERLARRLSRLTQPPESPRRTAPKSGRVAPSPQATILRKRSVVDVEA
jgi:hypothetical protein